MEIIKKNIYTNLLFNDSLLQKNILHKEKFIKTNINVTNVSNMCLINEYKENDYYMKLIRNPTRMQKNYNFYYISPNESNNKFKITIPVEINITYKLIFFCSCWSIDNIKKFDIINGNEIISLKSQINSTYINYITCELNSNIKSLSLHISFKNKQQTNYPNGLYLLQNYFIKNVQNKIYKNILSKKEKELSLYLNINKKTYDIVICIAIWNRHEILKKTIDLINSYNTNFKIGFVLIYSKESDNNLFPNMKNVHYFYAENQPLGSKWLSGIYHSQLFIPKMVMILGSDDLVSKEYIEDAYNSITIHNYDFCCTTHWLTYNDSNNKLYFQKYSTYKLLGAGRVISSRFLEKLNYKIYDPCILKGLDNTIRFLNNQYKPKTRIIKKTGILLYKGNWECISDVITLINSPLLKTKELDKKKEYVINLYRKFNIDII